MASIWHRTPDPALIDAMSKGTIDEHLGIKITQVGDDYLSGTMPADKRTFQLYGIVHGGANVVLAETLGSIAGAHVIDTNSLLCLGQEVSATHLRPVSSGMVTGIARNKSPSQSCCLWARQTQSPPMPSVSMMRGFGPFWALGIKLGTAASGMRYQGRDDLPADLELGRIVDQTSTIT